MVGAVSRRYEIVCRLAGGGMADLYLGRTLGPGGFERLVVIKRIAKRLASQPSAVQALFDEARIAATLTHANIVQVNDIEIAEGQVSIVMEFLHGHDVAHLLRRLKRNGELVPLDQAIAIVLAVCAGLHHAHERVDSDGNPLEIVHRDVSPHNVFVTYDGAVKLVDFGIARASLRKGHTQHGMIKGKPGYIAPEHIRGRRIDRRTDVWGAAVLLYELTTGRTPYGTAASFDDLVKVTKHDAPAPSTIIADYPSELEAIVMRGLERDPDARYSTAEAMGKELEAFAWSHGIDLSPFRMSALMERVFAENLEAWRQSQRMGRSLAEHVAAFQTSGGHDLIDLPGDPTEQYESSEPTKTLRSDELELLPPSSIAPTVNLHVKPVPSPAGSAAVPEESTTVPRASATVLVESATVPEESTTVPEESATVPVDSATMSFEPSAASLEATAIRMPIADDGIADILEPPRRPRWRKPVAIALSAPLVLIASVLAWGTLDSNQPASASSPQRATARAHDNTRATAVDEQPIARSIVVEPIETEPEAAIPAAQESESVTESAVAHASPAPARKRPSAKAVPKRRPSRNTPSPRMVAPPPPSAEDDLDALLPH